MRNPKWHRDEIILALDLYFSTDRGSMDSRNPKVIEVSEIINKLPLFADRPDEEKFRNPNGVALKLSNFRHFDEDYNGKGMKGGSKLDKIVFNEFKDQKQNLKVIASEIKKIVDNPILLSQVQKVEEDEVTLSESVIEGAVLYKMHKVIERNKSISIQKKKQALYNTGKLICEACVFDFESYYGNIGKGFIECHHRTPLSNFKVAMKTTLDDLALVCSNCHRMLHKKIDTITIEDLKMMIKYDRIS